MKKVQNIHFALVLRMTALLLLMSAAAASAQTQTLYATPGSPTWRDNYTGGSACLFTVGPTNVVVSHLGFFQSNAVSSANIIANGGLNTNHYVGIYSYTVPPQLLAQVIVPSGASADYFTNQFCWMPLDPPFLLSSNTSYYVAAMPYNGDHDLWGDSFSATFNPYFVGTGITTNQTAYGPGNATWPITGFSLFGSNTTYCVEGMANLAVDQARVGVVGTNAAVLTGGTISVVGYASGQLPINYQWYQPGSPPTAVLNQTNAILNIPSATPGNSGTYYLTASNALGGEQSANVQVLVSSTPVAVQQGLPASITNFANYPLTLSVVVTGSPPMFLEWSSNSVPMPSTIAVDSGSFTFASSYSLFTVYPANNSNQYTVVASNYVGSTYYATSSVAVTVLPNLTYPQEFLFGPPSTNVFNSNNGLGSAGNNMCGGRILTASHPVVVTHLGYDAVGLMINNQEFLQNSHNISLFNTNGTLLGNVVVTNGTDTNTAINGYFWAPLNPPLLLAANTTYILSAQTFASGSTPIDPWGDDEVPVFNPYFTPGGANNAALYGNTWPTAPASGGYGSQFYSAPNMALLTNFSAVYVSNSAAVYPNYQGYVGSLSNVVGTSLALIGSAEGQPPLYYPQWYFNGAPLASQTNVSLVIASVSSANAGSYYLVVSNYQTSITVTSEVTAVTVLTNPVILSQFPVTYTNNLNTNLMTVYAGASPAFTVSVTGASPFHYQWFTNGVATANGTNASYILTNAQFTSPTNFYCIITNIYGSATSLVWSTSIIADPTNSAGGLAPYPQTVLSLNPVGYWRLNEQDDGLPPPDYNAGVICHDYAGGNDGIYTNVTLNSVGNPQPAYNPTSDPSDSSAQFGFNTFSDSDVNSIAGINFGSPAGTSKAFTVEAWVNGYGQTADVGLVTLGYGGGGEQFDLDCGSDTAPTTHGFRFLIRDASGATHGVASTIMPSYGTWYHLVGVVDEISSQTVTFYINGQNVGTTAATNGSGVLASSIPMSIGARMAGPNTTFNDQFVGNISDVAVYNVALSSNQVLSEYLAGGQAAPYFSVAPPTNILAVVNLPLTLPAVALGSPVLGYQWVNLTTSTVLASGTGAANATSLNVGYTTNSTAASWNGQTLQLTVTNAYGTTNFLVAVTVALSPLIITDLPSPVTIGQGQTYTYNLGAVGLAPLAYQWYKGAVAVPGATNATYVPPSNTGSSNNFYVIVTNSNGSATSVISSFIVIPLPNTPLATAIASLNPIGYWPMHETNLPSAAGDIETNYGVSGLAETGYYPDWVGGGVSSAIQHGFPGAIAGDSDTAMCFNTNSGVGNGAYTNALYVPNATKGAVLNPPFSVECWFFPSNTTANDLWSQEGYEGLNAGTEGAGTGNASSPYGTNACGIRLYVGGNFNVYTYANNTAFSQPLANVGTVVATNWYHVVLTCDASTNISLYTNGIQCGATTAYVGLYYPDSWTPFEVASGRGNTRAKSNVAVDELAIYTNALSAAQILTDYQTGINPAPATSYFATIKNNNPWVYYRMDSPGYSTPPASSLPVLYNYGSVLGNGVYSPGTMPGVLRGPSSTYTASNQGTNVALLEGVSSFGDAGYNAAWDPSAKYGTSNQAFSVTCMFRGNPANNTFQDLVGHSDASWRMTLGANAAGGGAIGSVQFTYGATASSTITCNDGKWHQAVGVYQPGPSASPGVVTLYVDGQLNTFNGFVSSNGIAAGSALDVLLGAAPDYTNNPVGLGRQFNGELCDVAVFTNALTAAQVQALYNAAGGVVQTLSMPYSGQLPVTWNYLGSNLGNNLGATNLMTLYAGVSPQFMVTVSGAPVNSYQWYTNGVAVGFGPTP